MVGLVLTLFVLSLWVNHPLLSISAFALSQIGAAWTCHSQLHSHNKWMLRTGKVVNNEFRL